MKTTTVTRDGIKTTIEKGPITVRRVFVGEYQKPNTVTAELAQTITTTKEYPAARINSSIQDNIFAISDFDIQGQTYSTPETRMAWLPVPIGSTVEQVEAQLAKFPDATIYRILSAKPVLDDNQKSAVDRGIREFDFFGNNQVVRYPENEETLTNGTANKLILDRNTQKPFYRRTAFWTTFKEDVDTRATEEAYLTPEIEMELKGADVLESQVLTLSNQQLVAE